MDLCLNDGLFVSIEWLRVQFTAHEMFAVDVRIRFHTKSALIMDGSRRMWQSPRLLGWAYLRARGVFLSVKSMIYCTISGRWKPLYTSQIFETECSISPSLLANLTYRHQNLRNFKGTHSGSWHLVLQLSNFPDLHQWFNHSPCILYWA